MRGEGEAVRVDLPTTIGLQLCYFFPLKVIFKSVLLFFHVCFSKCRQSCLLKWRNKPTVISTQSNFLFSVAIMQALSECANAYKPKLAV